MWSPELIKDINKLEGVQKFALRVCTKQLNLSYADLMEKCSLSELRLQRNNLSLALLHKLINGDYVFPNAPLMPYSTIYLTRSHSTNAFVLPRARTNLLQNSFFPHTISSWNALPAHLTTTSSIKGNCYVLKLTFYVYSFSVILLRIHTLY